MRAAAPTQRRQRLQPRRPLPNTAHTRVLRALALLAALRDTVRDALRARAKRLGRQYPALRALWTLEAVASDDAQSRAAREAAQHYERLHAAALLPLLLLLPFLGRSVAAACRGWSLRRALWALVPPVPQAVTRVLFGTGQTLHLMPEGRSNVTVAARVGLLPPDFALGALLASLLAALLELARVTARCAILWGAVLAWRAGFRWLWPRTRDVGWARRWAEEATVPMRQPRPVPLLE